MFEESKDAVIHFDSLEEFFKKLKERDRAEYRRQKSLLWAAIEDFVCDGIDADFDEMEMPSVAFAFENFKRRYFLDKGSKYLQIVRNSYGGYLTVTKKKNATSEAQGKEREIEMTFPEWLISRHKDKRLSDAELQVLTDAMRRSNKSKDITEYPELLGLLEQEYTTPDTNTAAAIHPATPSESSANTPTNLLKSAPRVPSEPTPENITNLENAIFAKTECACASIVDYCERQNVDTNSSLYYSMLKYLNSCGITQDSDEHEMLRKCELAYSFANGALPMPRT